MDYGPPLAGSFSYRTGTGVPLAAGFERKKTYPQAVLGENHGALTVALEALGALGQVWFGPYRTTTSFSFANKHYRIYLETESPRPGPESKFAKQIALYNFGRSGNSALAVAFSSDLRWRPKSFEQESLIDITVTTRPGMPEKEDLKARFGDHGTHHRERKFEDQSFQTLPRKQTNAYPFHHTRKDSFSQSRPQSRHKETHYDSDYYDKLARGTVDMTQLAKLFSATDRFVSQMRKHKLAESPVGTAAATLKLHDDERGFKASAHRAPSKKPNSDRRKYDAQSDDEDHKLRRSDSAREKTSRRSSTFPDDVPRRRKSRAPSFSESEKERPSRERRGSTSDKDKRRSSPSRTRKEHGPSPPRQKPAKMQSSEPPKWYNSMVSCSPKLY
ncbi:hypothetical protein T439DRAFT_358944 [Meredithblackwellia eburnea MCA 4105]